MLSYMVCYFSFNICRKLTYPVNFLQNKLFSYKICREISYHVTQHNLLFLDKPTLTSPTSTSNQTFSQYILKVFQYNYSILPKKVLIRQYFNTFVNQKVLKIPIHQYFLRYQYKENSIKIQILRYG